MCHRTDPTTTVPLFLHKNSLRERSMNMIHDSVCECLLHIITQRMS